jgi:UMF1 family MFS transporter
MSNTVNQKKTIWAWTMYDWANSVFSLTIATAIFPPYYESVSKKAASYVVHGVHYIEWLGFRFVNTALYSYALSAGFLLVCILSPFLSGIADARGNKKFFLKLFCYTGSLACMLLYFFDANNILLGLLLFIIALAGFGGSIVFYNAFLPEITTEDQFDKVSARGFSMGYIGSVLLLIVNLITIMFPEWFFDVAGKARELQSSVDATEALKQAKSYYEGVASRLSFLSVGLWWAGFAQIPFYYLKEQAVVGAKSTGENIFTKGYHELVKVWREINDNNTHHRIKRYLWGFFFTSMGLQTVMYVASIFGSQELKLPTQDLIITILIIQLIAIAGAQLFSMISARFGNIYTLIIMIVIWIFICVVAYGIHTAVEFYTLGALVGVVMGGIQSLFRSTYAKIIPDNTHNTASYFSFYDVCEKLAIVLGTLSYGILLDITGNMRTSIIVLALYFVLGLFFIARIKNFKTLHP